MRTLSLLLSLWPLSLAGVSDPPAGNDPETLIHRAIRGHGGADKLDRLRLVREQTTGTLDLLGKKIVFTSETWQRLPGQFRHTLTSEVGGKQLTMIQVYDGKQGWVQEGGITRDASKQALAGWKAMAHAAHVSSLTPLLAADKGYRLTLLEEVKVMDRPALGVRITCPEQREVCLWFDRATGLLVRRDSRPHPGSAESVQQEIFSEFKDVNGLKRPSRVQILLNGVPHVEATIRSTQFLQRVDDKEFTKP
jgi:hypothetical protein